MLLTVAWTQARHQACTSYPHFETVVLIVDIVQGEGSILSSLDLKAGSAHLPRPEVRSL